ATACSTWSPVGTEAIPTTLPSWELVTGSSASPIAGRPASQKGRTSMLPTLCHRRGDGATPVRTIRTLVHSAADNSDYQVVSRTSSCDVTKPTPFQDVSSCGRFESLLRWLSQGGRVTS